MKALLVLAFGGPQSLEEVEFLLTRLFRGRSPTPEQLEQVKERYRLIGGLSPLLGITEKQAEALEERLHAKGFAVRAYVGMRYSHPLIEETVGGILRDGIREIIAVPMSPFRSRASTGAYSDEVNRVKEHLREAIQVTYITGWHLQPRFLEAVRQRIREGLRDFPPEAREKVHLIFTAHSLPRSIVEQDPYAGDFNASVQGVLREMDPLSSHMAYQSKGRGPEEWMGPDVGTLVEDLSREGVHNVLVIPIGFVSDHIEILYDLDIVLKKKAESLGIVLRRSPSLNVSHLFIDALASIVEDRMSGGIRGTNKL